MKLALRNAIALATTALFVMGCFGSGPTSATYTGTSPRSDAVLRQAATDLGCPVPQLRVVHETNRRYLNETAFRFVVEGCDERGGYLEACELAGDAMPPGWTKINDGLACRYVLLTRLRLSPPP